MTHLRRFLSDAIVGNPGQIALLYEKKLSILACVHSGETDAGRSACEFVVQEWEVSMYYYGIQSASHSRPINCP